jgi:hypothetical protein
VLSVRIARIRRLSVISLKNRWHPVQELLYIVEASLPTPTKDLLFIDEESLPPSTKDFLFIDEESLPPPTKNLLYIVEESLPTPTNDRSYHANYQTSALFSKTSKHDLITPVGFT